MREIRGGGWRGKVSGKKSLQQERGGFVKRAVPSAQKVNRLHRGKRKKSTVEGRLGERLCRRWGLEPNFKPTRAKGSPDVGKNSLRVPSERTKELKVRVQGRG